MIGPEVRKEVLPQERKGGKMWPAVLPPLCSAPLPLIWGLRQFLMHGAVAVDLIGCPEICLLVGICPHKAKTEIYRSALKKARAGGAFYCSPWRCRQPHLGREERENEDQMQEQSSMQTFPANLSVQ